MTEQEQNDLNKYFDDMKNTSATIDQLKREITSIHNQNVVDVLMIRNNLIQNDMIIENPKIRTKEAKRNI